MVWLILFLTVSNIAMGYGLAVYVQRQFGSALPSCSPLRGKKTEAPSTPEVVAEVAVVPSPALSETNAAKAPAAQETKSAEPSTSTIPANAAETSELPPVDEENVLAGIEEFRSQLAKMNVAAEESVEPAAADELATATS